MVQLTTEGSRQRKNASQAGVGVDFKVSHEKDQKGQDEHPAGPVRHGGLMQTLRIILFTVFFSGSCLFIHGAQLLGAPLYFLNRDYYYAYMALTKQYFGSLATQGTYWWSPTVVRISGDASMAGESVQLPDGRLHCAFPERLVSIANHQIYTDWSYSWWTAYTTGMHGHLYIISKESSKWVPVLGPAMQFYNFVFMARKWSKDQERLRYRLQKLNTRHSGPMTGDTGPGQLDPMWSLIFPEGTNSSRNTRKSSERWSEKSGIPDGKHLLLPRSTGLQFCSKELEETVEWVYDCTIAYEGIPHGQYGQDIFTSRSVYFQGRPPKSVNMHWRKYKVSEIPIDDKDKMEEWTLQRWREKDELLELFLRTGRFPADEVAVKIQQPGKGGNYIETEVRPTSTFEFVQIFTPVSGAAMIGKILIKMANLVLTGRISDD